MKKIACAHCGHEIDAAARLCPFCGADPESGRKADTSRIVETHFPRRDEKRGRARDFFRTRQSLLLSVLILVIAVVAIGLHQMVTSRALRSSTDAPAVPLTELTDISKRSQQEMAPSMPELEFSAEGDPRRVRTLLLEPGAVAPTPEPTPTPPPQPGQGATAQPAAAVPQLPQQPASQPAVPGPLPR
jgi:hypothetical protein